MSQNVNDLNNLQGLTKNQYGSITQNPKKKKRKFKSLEKINK